MPGSIGEGGAREFLANPSPETVARWRTTLELDMATTRAYQTVDGLKGWSWVPGFGAGLQAAEGHYLRAGGRFVVDVLTTVTGTGFISGAKSITGYVGRGSLVGGGVSGLGTAVDITAGHLEALLAGKGYHGNLPDDAWEILRATKNGAVLGAVLGPLARLPRVSPTSAPKAAVPQVTNPKLRNYVDNLYKGAKGPNPIGTGSTAAAVRNELLTGLPTHGRFHSQKPKKR